MPAEYVTRTRIAVDRGRAEAALEFERAAGKGKARTAAARRLAVIYRVEARHPYRTLHYNPAGSDAPAPTPDELRLDVSGDPERVARYLSAVPRYLARVEALTTKAVRAYGRWARSAAGEEALEYTDAGGARAYARRFRVEAFAAVADALGISSLPRYVDPAAPMWDQAARIAWDVVKAEGPVSLYAMHDEAEAEELLAAADRTPDPAAEAFERELAELRTAEYRRSARLFAALDGEELPADEAPVEEAEDVVEDQEDEELPAVELTPVQRRWLHTAAAHPEGFLPASVNLRTARSLGAAGLIRWTRPEGRTVPLAEAVWKLDAGEVRITAAGRRRAAAEERERVVIVACGGRKAVYADGVRKGEPVIGERAGALYVGSYHRAMRRAADVLTQGGRSGRVLILSAKYGLVELDRHLLNYDLRVGDPGTVDGETLRRQAHELGISGAAVTVLGGRAYVELAGEVWDELAAPLAGTRGIGEQLARLAAIYDPARAAVEAAAEDVVEDQDQEDEELLDVPAAPVRPVELVPAARPRGRSHPLSRPLSAPCPASGVTRADAPVPPALRAARQGRRHRGGGACPSNRWTAARRDVRRPSIGHGERVHRPVIALAVAALAVLATGCVSVPPADDKAPGPRARPVVSAAPSPAGATQAPAREELTRTDPDPSPSSAAPRPRSTPTAARAPRSVRPAPAVRPAVPPQGHRARPPAPPRRTVRPPVLRPSHRPARPTRRAPAAPSYSMRDVCRAADGVTDPGLASLCRSTYGG
ncbi:hypothetical protein N4G70_34150 [Streptomyces sp. ASQP_92]|uniref:DUF6884 domain-containing protein n=1 Tax=Streptomyces sp. ASQP_92 TaxID=2979116 RepID=UPI0021BF3B44|nr:DUF6884 domain-containing protein [Streptomyces sp. ASQP_92]MCT9093861.1 hypothetical protein [Streptomyces sp. ASQP_92]